MAETTRLLAGEKHLVVSFTPPRVESVCPLENVDAPVHGNSVASSGILERAHFRRVTLLTGTRFYDPFHEEEVAAAVAPDAVQLVDVGDVQVPGGVEYLVDELSALVAEQLHQRLRPKRGAGALHQHARAIGRVRAVVGVDAFAEHRKSEAAAGRQVQLGAPPPHDTAAAPGWGSAPPAAPRPFPQPADRLRPWRRCPDPRPPAPPLDALVHPVVAAAPGTSATTAPAPVSAEVTEHPFTLTGPRAPVLQDDRMVVQSITGAGALRSRSARLSSRVGYRGPGNVAHHASVCGDTAGGADCRGRAGRGGRVSDAAPVGGAAVAASAAAKCGFAGAGWLGSGRTGWFVNGNGAGGCGQVGAVGVVGRGEQGPGVAAAMGAADEQRGAAAVADRVGVGVQGGAAAALGPDVGRIAQGEFDDRARREAANGGHDHRGPDHRALGHYRYDVEDEAVAAGGGSEGGGTGRGDDAGDAAGGGRHGGVVGEGISVRRRSGSGRHGARLCGSADEAAAYDPAGGVCQGRQDAAVPHVARRGWARRAADGAAADSVRNSVFRAGGVFSGQRFQSVFLVSVRARPDAGRAQFGGRELCVVRVYGGGRVLFTKCGGGGCHRVLQGDSRTRLPAPADGLKHRWERHIVVAVLAWDAPSGMPVWPSPVFAHPPKGVPSQKCQALLCGCACVMSVVLRQVQNSSSSHNHLGEDEDETDRSGMERRAEQPTRFVADARPCMRSRPPHGVSSGETDHCRLRCNQHTDQTHCAWPRLRCRNTGCRRTLHRDENATLNRLLVVGGPCQLRRAMIPLVSSYVEKSNNTNDSSSSTSPSVADDL
eukprot:ctg_648.g157